MILLRAALLLVLLASGAHAAEDYCAYGKATAVLFVDRTTAFDQTDKTLFLQALDGVVTKLSAGDRLVAYTMTGAYTESRKVFDRCKPACPDEGFFGGLVATCRPVIARADSVGYIRELAQAIATLLREPEETRFSDLFRTVAENVRASANPDRPVRTVVVLSDLLENSPLMQERDFKRMTAPDILKRLSTSGVQVNLPGASVRVFGFGRDDSPGRPPLPQAMRQRIAEAWRAWFVAGGAADVDIGFR